MKDRISIVQLPFPALDYFPEEKYFPRLEAWYQENVSSAVKVPSQGIWEVPLWISWLRAFLLNAAQDLALNFDVNIIDLSTTPFPDLDPNATFPEVDSDLYIFSPLLQNYSLTKKVSELLRSRGGRVAVGGIMSSVIQPGDFDYIFRGRIEHNYSSFLSLIAEVYQTEVRIVNFSFERFQRHFSYDWATNYVGQIIYLRLFTQFGCPLHCHFCSDRNTGMDAIPSFIVEKELHELHKCFPEMDALYIGDLTFGVNKNAVQVISDALEKMYKEYGKTYKLIVQTNLSVITETFLDQLKQINVKAIEVGIESGSTSSVTRMSKKRPSSDWMESKLELMLNSGFAVAGNIIVGLPEDDEYDYVQTESLVAKWKDKVWFNIYGYVPYLNTPLFQKLKQDLRITNWNFEDWCEGKDLVFDPYFISKSGVRSWLLSILETLLK